jgi:hypothetical protein
MNCPKCQEPLTIAEVDSLMGERRVAVRKNVGRNGGRPVGAKDRAPRKKRAVRARATQ